MGRLAEMNFARFVFTIARDAVVIAMLGALGSCARSLPPYPQATIVVDTEMPVPALASHLRVDVFDASGTWISSRAFALRDPSNFPASFSVFVADDSATTDAIIRLRIYPDDAERDYLGERYRPFPDASASPTSVIAIPKGDGTPRLLQDGNDVTPSTEPLPEISIDRLVHVGLAPGSASNVRVTLRAACVGHMADIVNQTTCIDGDDTSDAPDDGDGPDDGSPSVAGSILGDAMQDVASVPAIAIAIRGGAFVLGGDELDTGLPSDQTVAHYPPRAAIVSSFALDREEVTVGALRAAIAKGFKPPFDIEINDGPLATTSDDPLASCTYSTNPDPNDPGRELLPATCVPFDTTRAYCKYIGGDLPTETQWEYAAAASGRAGKTPFPWGGSPPTCQGVIYGRFDVTPDGDNSCFLQGYPYGVRDAADPTRGLLDTTPDGVRGLAGIVYEFVQGSPLEYDSACYLRAGLVDPLCEDTAYKMVVARGGSFTSPQSDVSLVQRGKLPLGSGTQQGFRCAYAH